MRFHVEIIARENFEPMNAVPIQKMVFEQLNMLVESGKVKQYGIYADERGGFMIIEVDTPEELEEMLGPFFEPLKITAHPFVFLPTVKAFFDKYEQMMMKK
ncbi:MAG TPA: DUF3303 family protein [Methanomassiliicoccales archaeon]|nr:DUF3303 family protein [Methanomassiliicoccales archaeon]